MTRPSASGNSPRVDASRPSKHIATSSQPLPGADNQQVVRTPQRRKPMVQTPTPSQRKSSMSWQLGALTRPSRFGSRKACSVATHSILCRGDALEVAIRLICCSVGPARLRLEVRVHRLFDCSGLGDHIYSGPTSTVASRSSLCRSCCAV